MHERSVRMRLALPTRGLLAVLIRRWWVLIIGGLVVLVGLVVIDRTQGVYWTQADIVFLPPDSPGKGNVLEGNSDTLIYFAAIIDREFSGVGDPDRLSSAGATLYGAGIRQGYRVGLVNTGGQWRTSISRPVIAVEVVDTSADAVRTQMATIEEDIQRRVTSLQTASGADPAQFIQLQLAPGTPDISYITGSRSRAAFGVVALGAGLTISVAVLVDRILLRRRCRGWSTAPPDRPPTPADSLRPDLVST